MKENNTYDAIFKYSNILIVKGILIGLLKYEPPLLVHFTVDPGDFPLCFSEYDPNWT